MPKSRPSWTRPCGLNHPRSFRCLRPLQVPLRMALLTPVYSWSLRIQGIALCFFLKTRPALHYLCFQLHSTHIYRWKERKVSTTTTGPLLVRCVGHTSLHVIFWMSTKKGALENIPAACVAATSKHCQASGTTLSSMTKNPTSPTSPCAIQERPWLSPRWSRWRRRCLQISASLTIFTTVSSWSLRIRGPALSSWLKPLPARLRQHYPWSQQRSTHSHPALLPLRSAKIGSPSCQPESLGTPRPSPLRLSLLGPHLPWGSRPHGPLHSFFQGPHLPYSHPSSSRLHFLKSSGIISCCKRERPVRNVRKPKCVGSNVVYYSLDCIKWLNELADTGPMQRISQKIW